jgi:hypothetical protein
MDYRASINAIRTYVVRTENTKLTNKTRRRVSGKGASFMTNELLTATENYLAALWKELQVIVADPQPTRGKIFAANDIAGNLFHVLTREIPESALKELFEGKFMAD